MQKTVLLQRFFGPGPTAGAAVAVHAAILDRARDPRFYRDFGVPDTLDGRFDMIVLHGFLVLHRLKRRSAAADRLAQVVFDLIFTDIDRGLREMGVGDLGVSKRMKTMAKGFYGRSLAYEQALAAPGDAALIAALDHNLYGTVPVVAPDHLLAMARYVRAAARGLAATGTDRLLAGAVAFAPLPVAGPASTAALEVLP